MNNNSYVQLKTCAYNEVNKLRDGETYYGREGK